jgi:hypothetical protein
MDEATDNLPFRRLAKRADRFRFSDRTPTGTPDRPWWLADTATYWVDFTFADPVSGREWAVMLAFRETATAVDVVEVRAVATDGEGITGEALRGLPWGSLIADVRADCADFHRTTGAAAQVEKFTNTRRKITAEHLEQVAVIYRRHAAISKRPTEAVADAFGVPRDTASKWVRRARDAGLLGPTSKGKKGEQ